MRDARHDESKMDFQVERLTFFTDGVFAIAITLLVIEIKIPILSEVNDQALILILSNTIAKFFGFAISFVIIGYYWSVHHRIFGYVQRFTNYLFWVNLAFLFSIVTLPFSSGLVGEYSSHPNMNIPYVIYTVNMCLAGLMNCWLWVYVSNPKRELLTRTISKSRIRLGIYRSLVIPFIFLLSMSVSFFFPIFSRFLLIFIPLSFHWGLKALENMADHEENLIESNNY